MEHDEEGVVLVDKGCCYSTDEQIHDEWRERIAYTVTEYSEEARYTTSSWRLVSCQ